MDKILNEFELNRVLWKVPDRYTDLNVLGAGQSLVCSAFDTLNNKRVVLKKISYQFSTEQQAKRVYREIKLLKHVNHYNIISLLDIFTDNNSFEKFEHVYLVTNRMESDLNNYLRIEKLDEAQITFFAYQIFRALKYLHSSKIIHRDLKPANLTINEDWELRVIDFGLSRTQREDIMTEYIVSRWYRAPELILTMMNYTTAIDIWSVGCIIYEMHTNRPLFPGKNPTDQLKLIMDVVGFPSDSFMKKLKPEMVDYLNKLEIKPSRVNFKEYFAKSIPSDEVIDLLDKIFQLDPDERITSEQALEHPYFRNYHDTDDEPNGEAIDDSFENKEHSLTEWKRMIYDEILKFTPTHQINE